MKRLRIALTKGRLEKGTVEMFRKMGLNCDEIDNKGRRLILPVGDYDIVLAKAADVITYIENGVCDVGIVGKDTIEESNRHFYEIMDLGIGKCKFALAAPKGSNFYAGYSVKCVASKYPEIARRFFAQKAMDVKIIKIEGSVELAPLLGLADGIVDIVESGKTLVEHGLEVIEDIMPISARVIVNLASMKLHKNEIDGLVRGLEKVTAIEE